MSRGKLLHSGMTSLNSFQPAADRFCSWLSEIESNIEILEATGEKLRIKYKDKDIPETELVKFKVSAGNKINRKLFIWKFFRLLFTLFSKCKPLYVIIFCNPFLDPVITLK